MNEEQQPETKLEQSSRTGLVIGFLMMILLGLAVMATVNLWPIFESLPVSPPETIERE